MEFPDFSKIFHQSSKNLEKGHALIPLDEREWPKEWRTIEYKKYPRLKAFALPPSEFPEATFDQLVSQRKSSREFSGTNPSLKTLSSLLRFSCGKISENGLRRAQPSAGARFPIEVYVLMFKGGELPQGVYHYNIDEHNLECVWEHSFSEEDLNGFFPYTLWAKKASFAVVLTAVFSRNQRKYGERGYRHILIEAGHIGQNLYLASSALGLGCCGLGRTQDERLEEALDVDGVTESALYTLVFG